MNSFNQLLSRYKEQTILGSIGSVLAWDTNTSLPPAGVEYRSEQASFISRLSHKMLKDPEYKKLLENGSKDLSDDIERRDYEILERNFKISTAFDDSFVSKISKQANLTFNIWRKAKQKSDFSLVETDLSKLFNLTKERGEVLMDVLDLNDPFEALIQVREPKFSKSKITQLFNESKDFLIPMVDKYSTKSSEYDFSFLNRPVPKSTQEELVKEVARLFNYDFESQNSYGRIGEVEHPLTITCGPRDVRVTVSYNETDVLRSVSAMAHELGHAIDKLGRNNDWLDRPIYNASSPSIAECYSRFTENKIGNSLEFWKAYFPRFQKITGDTFKDIDFERFYLGINRIKPDVSRMRADELTYLLHIIIRFELEQELFSEKLTIKEAPAVWNEKYQKYLGVTVNNDTEGIMQDLHWFSYYWAYFQGYGLGDIAGSQIHHTLLNDQPDVYEKLSQGDSSEFRSWLDTKVFINSGRYDPLDLFKKITGEELQSKYHKNYLTNKFEKLF